MLLNDVQFVESSRVFSPNRRIKDGGNSADQRIRYHLPPVDRRATLIRRELKLLQRTRSQEQKACFPPKEPARAEKLDQRGWTKSATPR